MEPADKQFFLKQLGKHISNTRASKGMTSAELARKTYSDTSLIARIEMGRTNPTATTLKMICEALDVTFEELFKGFEFQKNKLDSE